MTTADSAITKLQQPEQFFVFPDPPEISEDKMTNFDHLAANGNVHHLALHLGNPDTTLVAGERYLALTPTQDMTGLRYPDLLIAFGVDPAAYHRRRAYVISDQGKPPDFVMEVASPSTRRTDATDKRNDYAALGIPEYWRFDETIGGRLPKLAGDRLVGGEYEPIPVEELAEGMLQGYSTVLNLHLRWEQGWLGWYDPATGRHILTFTDERARADRAEAELDAERAARIAEREARVAAQARIADLEERLRSQSS
jgi:Uma2 family endonuclease